MKKKGFTLAEVLITLAIIGTIAAITLPSLMTDTTSAQIGPKLAKAVSMFEQANEAILNEHSVDTLTDANLLTSVTTYTGELGRHLKGTVSEENDFLSKDGMLYKFKIGDPPDNPTAPGHMQKVGDVTVDINGSSKPNADGTDIFYFSWWNDGSLRPKGATNWNGLATSSTMPNYSLSTQLISSSEHWGTKCPRAENGNVSDYKYCAGHVFENNLKVLYR